MGLINIEQANSIKFIKLSPETAKRVAKTSNQFWFAGILFSIINGAFKVCLSPLSRDHFLDLVAVCTVGQGIETAAGFKNHG